LRLPRDVSGDDLIRVLGKRGYRVTRQIGSHVRLSVVTDRGEHHVTVPRNDRLRVGTLASVLSDVAAWLEIHRDDLVEDL
jgi:predicted RNA binding protein YcfA (HicA-like mRNA interferase family)